MARKKGRVKLVGKARKAFRNKVFERDGWKCRNPTCKSRENLTPHHIVYQSKQGDDTLENCLTLCVWCQTGDKGIHNHYFLILNKSGDVDEIDANEEVQFVYADGKVRLG